MRFSERRKRRRKFFPFSDRDRPEIGNEYRVIRITIPLLILFFLFFVFDFIKNGEICKKQRVVCYREIPDTERPMEVACV